MISLSIGVGTGHKNHSIHTVLTQEYFFNFRGSNVCLRHSCSFFTRHEILKPSRLGIIAALTSEVPHLWTHWINKPKMSSSSTIKVNIIHKK